MSYLARIAIAKNNLTEAKSFINESLQKDAMHRGFYLEALIAYAEYLESIGMIQRAVRTMQFIHDHPITEKRDQDLSKELLEAMEGKLDFDTLSLAKEESKQLTLDQTIEEALLQTR